MVRKQSLSHKKVQIIKEVAELMGMSFEDAKQMCQAINKVQPAIDKYKYLRREDAKSGRAEADEYIEEYMNKPNLGDAS